MSGRSFGSYEVVRGSSSPMEVSHQYYRFNGTPASHVGALSALTTYACLNLKNVGSQASAGPSHGCSSCSLSIHGSVGAGSPAGYHSRVDCLAFGCLIRGVGWRACLKGCLTLKMPKAGQLLGAEFWLGSFFGRFAKISLAEL